MPSLFNVKRKTQIAFTLDRNVGNTSNDSQILAFQYAWQLFLEQEPRAQGNPSRTCNKKDQRESGTRPAPRHPGDRDNQSGEGRRRQRGLMLDQQNTGEECEN